MNKAGSAVVAVATVCGAVLCGLCGFVLAVAVHHNQIDHLEQQLAACTLPAVSMAEAMQQTRPKLMDPLSGRVCKDARKVLHAPKRATG